MIHFGLWYHYKYERTDNTAAQEVIDRALSLEPGNVQGMVTFSLVTMHAANLGWSDDRDATQARALARQALVTAPDDPSTNFALRPCARTWLGPKKRRAI